MSPLLEVRNLTTCFTIEGGEFAAVDGVSFSLEAGRTLGIVGESGCGKSVTSLSIMGLVPQPRGVSPPAKSCSKAPTCASFRTPPCASCAATGSR